jgi:hypothetical protein
LLFDKDAGHMLFMEEVYEQTCRFIPGIINNLRKKKKNNNKIKGASWTNGFEDKKPYYWANYVKYIK